MKKIIEVRSGKVEIKEVSNNYNMEGIPLEEVIKDMTPEQLERFKTERYEKFLKPLMHANFKK